MLNLHKNKIDKLIKLMKFCCSCCCGSKRIQRIILFEENNLNTQSNLKVGTKQSSDKRHVL